jgi:hypothetical protein
VRQEAEFELGESTKAREKIRAGSWRDRKSRAAAVDDYNIDRHEKGRAANRERGTLFSVVPPNNVKLTKGIFLKTSFWKRGTSDRYRETPRPAVIPQIARVGLKRLMTLFVGTFVLSYRRGYGERGDIWHKVIGVIEGDTDEMDNS